MLARGRWGVWTLRSHLSALLLASMLLTLVLAGGAVLAYRIPGLERESQQSLLHEVQELGARMELLLGTRQDRLELLAALLQGPGATHADRLLDEGVDDGAMLSAVLRVSPQGRVSAVGLPEPLRARRGDLLGSDLSGSSLLGALGPGPGVVWSGRYLSVLTGRLTAGLAFRSPAGETLLAEVPIGALLDTMDTAAGARPSSIWVVDPDGEIIADTVGGRDAGKVNIRNWPLMQAVREGSDGSRIFPFPAGAFRVATAHSRALGWYFIGHAPVGLANAEVRHLVLGVGVAFFASLGIGLLMAPFWAGYLARPLQTIVARATQTMRGASLAGPDGTASADCLVAEYNRLSRHLAAMAVALRERELTFLAIFNAAPVPMAVTDADHGMRLLDANEAWCQALQHRREDAIGRTGVELGLFTAAESAELVARLQDDGLVGEGRLRRADGETMLCQIYGRRAVVGGERWLIWASIDIGPMRRMQQQLRGLNRQLEASVQQRTEALGRSNAELSQTAARLRAAQRELVRAEKMAALGKLVAGVAHELHTPLGNGMMAVSAMGDATRSFQAAAQGGLRRRDLVQLVESLGQGVAIAGRNLRRAAELVHSFKQVAVDQTSAQRRSFELSEVVHEMVVSLKPSFASQPWRIEVDVPASGLRMDSYPGALGQALGHLIENAVVHGFEGRTRGTVRITAGREDRPGGEGRIWLHVVDDGRGIAAGQLDRLFEPFVTTRTGHGGGGLGLHIASNAVTKLLGGTLTVDSVLGQGACFAMRLPVVAPDAPKDSGWLLP
nr:ATP-binding protein [Variovorax boronicumulans]